MELNRGCRMWNSKVPFRYFFFAALLVVRFLAAFFVDFVDVFFEDLLAAFLDDLEATFAPPFLRFFSTLR